MAPDEIHIVRQITEGVLRGEIGSLAKAITYTESTLPKHLQIASAILENCLPHSGNSLRVGITGVPGVGKSTFINALGKYLRTQGHRIAVLAIDPSSSRSKGSILGDKTRMSDIAADPGVFIRPSPAASSLGGVAARTREAILLCEAAGFDRILVETVGVGQSETKVYDMVDVFTLLLLPGGGDELQGIKKGIVELADVLIVNKADGTQLEKARETAKQYQLAMTLMPPGKTGSTPKVSVCSALHEPDMAVVWEKIAEIADGLVAEGKLLPMREEQDLQWFEEYTGFLLHRKWLENESVIQLREELRNRILNREISPGKAAEILVSGGLPSI